MAEAFTGFFLLMFMLGLAMVAVKYRKWILDWLNRPPIKSSESRDMRDFDTLTALGVPEQDAITRIVTWKKHRKEISDALDAEKEEVKNETGA